MAAGLEQRGSIIYWELAFQTMSNHFMISCSRHRAHGLHTAAKRLGGVGPVGDVGPVGPVGDVGDVGCLGLGFSIQLLAENLEQPWTTPWRRAATHCRPRSTSRAQGCRAIHRPSLLQEPPGSEDLVNEKVSKQRVI